LRHLPNWQVGEAHSISAEVRVVSHLDPDKVTVPQIHGIQQDRRNAPPQARAGSARLAVFCKAAARGQTPNAQLKTPRQGKTPFAFPLSKFRSVMLIKIPIP